MAAQPTTTSIYDYRPLLTRTDPSYLPLNPSPAPELDMREALTGTFAGTAPVIDEVWSQLSIAPAAVAAMTAVRDGFTAEAQQRGFDTWPAIPGKVVSDFVRFPDLSDETRRLRKNVVHSCYLALMLAGLHTGGTPAEGIDPVPKQIRRDERGSRLGNPKTERVRNKYSDAVHVRAATHDEMLLVRLAAGLGGTSRFENLCAAAVAAASSSATTAEVAQMRWAAIKISRRELAFAGRPADVGRPETRIDVRRVTPDSWALVALAAWRKEKSVNRPVGDDEPAFYGGTQLLTSNSATVCVDQQIRRALEIADLRREPGLTAGSLRYWAAARVITSFPTLADGAATAGVDPLTLHRQITQQGERGLRRAS